MEMVNRYSNPGSFRYGFNGKEKDNEDYGEGNSYDYGNRIYNSRLGKFLSTDPISSEYPELSPYQFASDRPIDGIDRDGLEWFGDPSVPYEIARAILFGWVDDVKEGGLNIREGTTQRGAAENNAASYNNSQVPQKVQDILKANNKASGTEKMVRGTDQMIQGGIEGVSTVVPLGEELNGVKQVGKVAIKKVEQKALSGTIKAGNSVARRSLESSGRAIAQTMEKVSEETLRAQRLHHIFSKEEHALSSLVTKFGSQSNAFDAVQTAANKALKEGKLVVGEGGILPTKDAGNIIEVEGINVRLIGGRVVDGKVEISSFSRKGLK